MENGISQDGALSTLMLLRERRSDNKLKWGY